MFKISSIQIIGLAVLMTASFSVFAQIKVVVIPLAGEDVEIVPTNKVLFFTDSVYNGDLGGISGADDICQSTADNANPALEGRFKAWLSNSVTPAVQLRSSFAQYDLPYVNVDGSLIANNFDDFLDGIFTGVIKSITNRINPTFSGGVNFGIWTGTSNTGTPIANRNCNGWTESSGAPLFGRAGVADGGTGTGGRWSDAGFSFGCSDVARLYCFQQ